jgi:GH15 family glucan-1,4-alpha-glucosidase
MASRLDDYAIIGDTQTAALVAKNGSIDWLCLPRFDGDACFAALLGKPEHGRWLLTPREEIRTTRRRYRPRTLILETELETTSGVVRITDFMPPRGLAPDIVRLVEGLRGMVPMRLELIIRYDYGAVVPWVRRDNSALSAVAGPHALHLYTPVITHGEHFTTVADFAVPEGGSVPFVLTWCPSHESEPPVLEARDLLRETDRWWCEWSRDASYEGPWKDAVTSSLTVLKALTFGPTGGIVAAPTTSLPEWPGGIRNWDYRYCWLRDATLTLYALLLGGYRKEAVAWRDWLLRAVAGDPARLQIMYGVAGERRLSELELPWLPGYSDARPVRVGNAASEQLQLDVYGEVMDMLFQAHRVGIPPDAWAWRLQRKMLAFLTSAWRHPDHGIWEVRGPPRHFTHSKMMAWVAFDRAVKMVEQFGADGPVDTWRQLREQIHREVCDLGYDAERNTFTQYYGGRELDASLLLMPLVGFLPPTDPRVIGTVEAVERELVREGYVLRYSTEAASGVDGLPPGEGAFLACTFWLADALALLGRRDEAEALFERLMALRNDVGLLPEEYDPRSRHFLGNFPQALSHLALVNTACNLGRDALRPAEHRRVC